MSKNYVTPNDAGIIGKDDSESIQNAVDYAKASGLDKVVIPHKNERSGGGIWMIKRAILLPSYITVVLDNCRLRLADGVFDNIFRNKNTYTDIDCKRSGEQSGIAICGEGHAVLDGGKTNFLFEFNVNRFAEVNSLAGMRVNNLIFLHNVNDFRLENFEVKDQRWWAINCLYCSNGVIADITSRADNYVPNQDGINLRQGCNNIVVERISGSSGDDLVALSAFSGKEDDFAVSGKDSDIHDITIKDVIGTSVKQGMVALRNQDDKKIYNVRIENVIHSNLNNNNYKGYVSVRVGENGYYKNHESPMGSTKNVKVKNVIASTSATVMVGATLCDCEFENIRADGGYWVFLAQGVKMKNVKINGAFYEQRFFEKQSGANGVIEDVNPLSPNGFMRADDYVENLRINDYVNVSGTKDIFIDGNVKNEIYLDGEKL